VTPPTPESSLDRQVREIVAAVRCLWRCRRCGRIYRDEPLVCEPRGCDGLSFEAVEVPN